MLHPFLSKFVKPGWCLGLLLILLMSVPRFWLVLHANITGAYQSVSIIFVIMMVLPFLLLSREGRFRIGMQQPQQWQWILFAILLGAACSGLLFLVGQGFFGQTDRNWFAYIARTYTNLPDPLDEHSRLLFFLIYAGISMTFSPIGEEFFYRGLIHELFAVDLGDQTASIVDSSAFALVHLAHFGIIYSGGTWRFEPLAALLWVGLLFGTCLFFYRARKRSGSIWGAVSAHAGFNLGMHYFIFYWLL
jgi:membrane protease YdiL (CAAX protease family)